MTVIGYRALLLAGIAATGAAHAQPPAPNTTSAAAAQPQTSSTSATDAASPDAGNQIVVTGSRIRRPDFAAPNPIVSFNAANIQQSGNTNITNFLLRVPALTNSIDNTQTSGSTRLNTSTYGAAGLNLLDLRGLGPKRTLVLVNGRRHVSGQIDSAAVDINSIPTDLIERTDVLTGGASAVYGADGVSGVVNFILKRNFEGISGRAQLGISGRGDAGNRFVSVQAGHNFSDGRGNVTLAYEYNADDRLANNDRAYLRQNRRRYLIDNDAYDPAITGSTNKVLQGDLRYPGESPYGVIHIPGQIVNDVEIGGLDFRGDGQVYNPGRAVSYYATGGDATPVAGFVGDLLPRTRRNAVNLLTHYDFSDAAKLSLEGKFVQVDATTFDTPTGNYPAAFTLDNPFVPTSIRTAALAAGQDTIFSTRDNLDFPLKGERDRRRTWRGVADLTGSVSDHATYDLYYTYGRTDVRITKLNDRWNDRYTAALDVVTDPRTGRPTCRSNLDPTALQTPAVSFTPGANSGCVPVNTFGVGTVDRSAIDFFLHDDVSHAHVTQQVVNASLTGDFGALFTLPGGPLQFAAGGEYRRETSRFSPSQFLQQKQWYQYDEGNSFDPNFLIQPSRGSFDVKEVFGELNAPILKDVPFAQTLSIGAAGRFSHYSTIGNTKSWQFNGVYAPISDITFRGSYGRSVRAPNIGELFQPTSATSSFFDDPCYVTNRGSGSQFRAANCAALIGGLGGNLAAFTGANNPNAASLISGSQRGNPDLSEETATTWTAGIVLRPRFVPGLSISADWYDIRLRGAISNPALDGPQRVAELCVDQPTLDNVYCAAVSRQQGTGYINGYVVQPENVARFRAAGLDLNINYQITTARLGAFDMRFVGGYRNRLETVATAGAAVENQVDQPNRPKFNFVFSPTWTLGGLTVSYNLRWFDRTLRYPKLTTAAYANYTPPNLFRYRELWQHDLQVQYALPSGFAFYAGVTNLTDQKPDEDAINLPISALGRFLYAGVRVNLSQR